MLEVFFAATPNGWKVSIALEELKSAGCNIDWKVVNVNLATDMFTDWYMEVSPNSKMPAIRDDGFTMFESGAILHYLADKFPGVLLPKDPHKKWNCLSWLHWQMANVGPMFGNRLTYIRYLPEAGEVHPHPQERFGKEARRASQDTGRERRRLGSSQPSQGVRGSTPPDHPILRQRRPSSPRFPVDLHQL